MNRDQDAATLETLDEEACLRLLRTHSIGRLAVAADDQPPLVVPVNYVVVADTVVFRSGPGEKLTSLRRHPVSFQVDEFDYLHRTGWSVLVQGIAYEATHYETDHLDLEPWGGPKPHWLRLVPARITGRRLVLPAWQRPSHGYL